jgi:hypothetical protein
LDISHRQRKLGAQDADEATNKDRPEGGSELWRVEGIKVAETSERHKVDGGDHGARRRKEDDGQERRGGEEKRKIGQASVHSRLAWRQEMSVPPDRSVWYGGITWSRVGLSSERKNNLRGQTPLICCKYLNPPRKGLYGRCLVARMLTRLS